MGAALACLVLSQPCAAQSPRVGRESLLDQIPSSSPALREGANLESTAGSFVRQGDRLVFVLPGGARLITLENLNLQRVADKLDVDGASLSWTVSGQVTECRGAFYLLITRAQARRGVQQEARRPVSTARRRVRQ